MSQQPTSHSKLVTRLCHLLLCLGQNKPDGACFPCPTSLMSSEEEQKREVKVKEVLLLS